MTHAHTSDPQGFIRIENLAKRYGSHTVFQGISFDVHKGEVLAIIGPSGSGKSTLLRCINFLETPDAGRITVAGNRVDAGGPINAAQCRKLRSRVGMVFQSFNLFPHLSVIDNIALPQRRVLGRSAAEARQRAAELLERVGLADKADSYPARCSGGQQQRIAIARALALDPEVMLFDEPTSALDPELGLEVLAVMRELAASGMTMIVVTHEMSFARNVSENVMIMADGKILEHGPSREVMDDPRHERTRRFLRAVTDR
ncbi:MULTISPECIES: amino acid ABC transporter ATP-binding protein [unclassified Paracoccus (in: a-proteobacteria)]|uniref:amino acid ABC transporter ATP-binding protein n=1 Tax=unclassified Paracoccus (in: a-proteobacteria) TaxID=2688777 RepID=UPI00160199EF|nr:MULTISPECIES: amino acid ABC transporter ATP-binding protein [unclassified Paracoccus (in: a-proteobacteria)]MBB1492913.1 amino acid ABC transporter ATP-binding protein [Paracoccus sp. MC1854]MBB1499594.1 amino acid ABC transporter ATP-binding protein [Paracoccus sp. MC1862]QQO44980.1 amino acid ABC transporter ATP-binding protein [Paracoccus sp. MC1862]